MTNIYLDFLRNKYKEESKNGDVIANEISKETGIPVDMINIHFFYYLEPNDKIDKIYNENDIFDPVKTFKDYFSYEEYDRNKKYEKEYSVPTTELRDKLSIIECTYMSEKKLSSYFYVAVERNTRKYKIYYVSREILSEEGIKLLTKYCRCHICTIPWYLPAKYLGDGSRGFYCCITTMESNVPTPNYDVLKRTRRYINEIYK